ncbi:MAG: type 1 glutamine amidotransferase [Pseudomonadota bacterium]|nr:type 1 glutamine amidotransferase [Pseudomonadota bacterium]
MLATDGFEQGELLAPVAALKEAGATIVIVALHPGRIRGMQVHETADLVKVDKAVSDVRAHDYDGLLIPGGHFSADLLRQSAQARAFIGAIDALGKPIAAMSQAPLLLASAGLAKGRMLASSPGARDDLVNAGAIWLNEDVVRDANWLSGRGRTDMAAFVKEMMALFAGGPAMHWMQQPVQSDPQPGMPADTPGQPLRWLATPSVGTMLSLALLGLGVLAAKRGAASGETTRQAAETGQADAAGSVDAIEPRSRYG